MTAGPATDQAMEAALGIVEVDEQGQKLPPPAYSNDHHLALDATTRIMGAGDHLCFEPSHLGGWLVTIRIQNRWATAAGGTLALALCGALIRWRGKP
jgi:hypothetical protein